MQTVHWRSFDVLLVLAALALASYGVLVVYSATAGGVVGRPLTEGPPLRQLIYCLVGFTLFTVVVFFDYRLLGVMVPALYGFSLASLALVDVLGILAHGSRRWISLGLFDPQPSELAKLVVIIALAKFFHDRQDKVTRFSTFVLSILLILPPVALIYVQPDLGTVVVFVLIWFGMALMAGVRLLYLLGLAAAAAAAAPLAVRYLLHGYMRERLETFLDPARDPLGAGYNVLQSSIGVGSGGFWGKGFLHGTQSQLDFLRVKHTDFIFSVLGEELGFVGASVLFFLFLVLLFRCLHVAGLARDVFGRLIATGVAVFVLAQVFINVGVNVRLLPVTGVPLPFISYGGSSLLTLLLSLGLLESIAIRHRRVEF